MNIACRLGNRDKIYKAWVRFRIQVRVQVWVWVRVRDSAIFEKLGCSGAAIKKLLKIFLYSEFNIFYIKHFKERVEFIIKKQLFMICF